MEPPLSDQPIRTTYRCIRMGCRLTVRLLNPIERCPRCAAFMAEIDCAQLDLDTSLATASGDVIAGFEELLRAAA